MHDEGGGEDMGDGDNTLDITNVINATTTSFYNVNDNISTKIVKSTVRRVVGMQENFDERENKEVSPIVTSVGTGIEAALEMRDKESHTFAGSRGVGAVGGTNTALHAGTIVLNDLTPGDVAQGEFTPSGKLQPSAQPSQPPSGGQKTTNNVEMVLDEVTDMAISESGIFCTKVDFIGSVELFREEHVKTSKKRGFMLQQGVLRTNCIDCIDRTNAAQTFMGIKMLNVALKSIGCRNANESALGSEHPLIQGLIAMYVDLGNHLSLQYGGSEAHLKFEGFNSTKSTLDEQFTSLKRYYSNSFEDHIKQHAMNVFLGMYAPMKEGTPLWESTDDYHLHNRRLKPVESYVDRILFEKIIFDVRRMCRLSNKVIGVKQLEDGKGGDEAIQAFMQGFELLEGDKNDGHKPMGELDLTTAVAPDEDEVDEDEDLPVIDLGAVLSRYAIRTKELIANNAAMQSLEVQNTFRSSAKDALRSSSPMIFDENFGKPTSDLKTRPRSALKPTRKMKLQLDGSNSEITITDSALRSILRSEKRKFIATNMKRRMNGAEEVWWKSAIKAHCAFNKILSVPASSDSEILSRYPIEKASSPDSGLGGACGNTTRAAPYTPTQRGGYLSPLQGSNVHINWLKRSSSAAYFDRVHQPHQLTDFDSSLSMEYVVPANAAALQRDLAAEKEEEDERNAYLASVAAKYNIPRNGENTNKGEKIVSAGNIGDTVDSTREPKKDGGPPSLLDKKSSRINKLQKMHDILKRSEGSSATSLHEGETQESAQRGELYDNHILSYVEKIRKRDQALLDTNNLNTILDSLDKAQGSNMELFGFYADEEENKDGIDPMLLVNTAISDNFSDDATSVTTESEHSGARQGIMTSINLFDDPINSADKNNIAFTSRKDAATLPNCSIGPCKRPQLAYVPPPGNDCSKASLPSRTLSIR